MGIKVGHKLYFLHLSNLHIVSFLGIYTLLQKHTTKNKYNNIKYLITVHLWKFLNYWLFSWFDIHIVKSSLLYSIFDITPFYCCIKQIEFLCNLHNLIGSAIDSVFFLNYYSKYSVGFQQLIYNWNVKFFFWQSFFNIITWLL